MRALTTSIMLAGLFTLKAGLNPTHASDLTAVKITPANAATHVQSGHDAIGGIGDWALSNGTLCLILAGLENEGDFSPRGGTLRDIGFCDRADDQFVSQQDLLDGSLAKPVSISDVRASIGQDNAALTTLGQYRGFMIETRYTLDNQHKARIGVQKRIWRADEDAADTGILATATLNYHSMKTFLLNTRAPERSNGFAQEQFVGRGILSYTDAARPVDTVIMMSPHDLRHPVSYAMRQRTATLHKKQDGETHALPAFALSDSSALAFLTLTAPFSLGDGSRLGLAQLLQVPFMGLDEGDEIILEEEIWVVPSADVAAVTDIFFADAPLLTGHVAAKNDPVRVHIDRVDGTPFTQTTIDQDGRFDAHLPVGDYRLRVLSPAADPLVQTVSVPAQGLTIDLGPLPQAARIALPRGAAMRLAFRGTKGTPDPHFEDDLTGYVVSGEDGVIAEEKVSDVHLTGRPHDPTHIVLPDGDYIVYGVRGPEYEVTQTRLEIRDGADVTLNLAAPQRALSTPDHMAADMHVHAAPSLDNAFSTVKRVRTFVAEHGEIMVAAEHDTVFDFNPLLRDMQLSDKMIAITGTEVTSTQQTPRAPYSIGHMNFFPLEVKPHAHKRGLPNHENRRTRDVLHDMHVHFDDPVAQLNHPRDNFALTGETLPDDFRELINDEQFFDHMGVAAHPYNPHRSIDSVPNNSLIEKDAVTGKRDIDFDVLEIMNGSQGWRPERVDATRQDWLSLVSQGIKIAATANSDSHNKWQQVALPRNMVRLGADRPADFSLTNFTKSVKAGAFYGTTGPFLDLRLGEAKIGDTHKGKTAQLSGRVFAADWAMADELRVQVNGTTIATQKLSADGRFDMRLDFDKDSYVTLEAIGQAGEIYKAVYPGFYPYAYSNPIYVDADGDGRWAPPGLPQ